MRYKSCVKSNSKKFRIRHTSFLFELHHQVSKEMDIVLQFKINVIISFIVKFNLFLIVFVAVNQIVLQTSNKIDFIKWCASSYAHALHAWNSSDANPFECFNLWTFDNSFVKSFKIIDKSNLTRLTNSFFICKSSSTKKLSTIYDIIIEA